jgi:hypothetical protein
MPNSARPGGSVIVCAASERQYLPTWIHGGWHDVYNRSNFRMYVRIATPPGAKQVVVDDSYHSAPGSGFGMPGAPQYLDELQCAWFDRWVKGIDNGIDRDGPITVRRLGGGWVARDRYPDPAARRFPRCWCPWPAMSRGGGS